MNGLLIYSKTEAQRNRFAVEKFKKLLGVRLVFEEDIDLSAPADYVINRTNNAEIARAFEARGVRVFNPANLTELANNKQKCYEFMQANGVEIMPINRTAPPLVKKPVGGKGGSGVELITEGEITVEQGFVYQKPASDLGRDLRVWLIGGEIIAAILRVSKTDFRSNFCLGGEAVPYSLSADEAALVRRIAGLVDYDYIGIPYFELEDGTKTFTVEELRTALNLDHRQSTNMITLPPTPMPPCTS